MSNPTRKALNDPTVVCCERDAAACDCDSTDLLTKIRSEAFAMGWEDEGSRAQIPHLNQIAALATRCAELIKEENPVHWTAGWNIPGYLPEVDPEHFETWDQALEYIRDTVQRFWDQDEDGAPLEVVDPITGKSTDADERWLPIDTALNLATKNVGWSAVNGDGHLVFWINQFNDED